MGSGSFFGIGGWEFIILLLVFVLIVGPQRLPEYTRNIVRMVRRARQWVDESRESVENEMGIAVDDLKKYDPRQYDPRRIIRDAWGDTSPIDDLVKDTSALVGSSAAGVAAVGEAAKGSGSRSSSASTDVADARSGRAPFDDEAT
ncbi:twin-arginine translocase TatA/TatE family subunit [Brachybacterium huguangmaarense]|uniref:Twin-arginine translocase TatA/TatE family subunit n=1 Tax=Brachybacterium huguangmaarense TaxID=1652028 RepID=A0ABY6G100_9MICO|nr:twin-arginine translocase TatA/TatE family subunit [Brachybacterium huguangmaarense]UYG16812.1 twin-arginine translocase TatA/TatE family subunit [Brachybacterium huguangmaarense]